MSEILTLLSSQTKKCTSDKSIEPVQTAISIRSSAMEPDEVMLNAEEKDWLIKCLCSKGPIEHTPKR